MSTTNRPGHRKRGSDCAWRVDDCCWVRKITDTLRGRPPEFLSSHPAEASRVQQIQALLPTVMPLYDAARRCG